METYGCFAIGFALILLIGGTPLTAAPVPTEKTAVPTPSMVSVGTVTVQTVKTGTRASIVVLVNNRGQKAGPLARVQAHALTTSADALQSFSREYANARVAVSDSFIEIVPMDGRKGLVLATQRTARDALMDAIHVAGVDANMDLMMFDQYISVISTSCSDLEVSWGDRWSQAAILDELSGAFADSIALFGCGSGGRGARSCSNGSCSVGCRDGYYACCGVLVCTCKR